MAYAHLFFNLTGIIIWYSIWPLRAVPIRLAKALGDTTAKYRWFALAYLAVCFFIVPAIFMGSNPNPDPNPNPNPDPDPDPNQVIMALACVGAIVGILIVRLALTEWNGTYGR